MNSALVIMGASFVLALGLGVYARRGHTMNLEQWSLGGRGFGSILVFVLMAGEIYTTFTFLGGSGWAYGKGGPTFYILCTGSIAYGMSYFLLPIIWRYAKTHDLVSQADFFIAKYDSRSLGVLVALVSVVALVPYLVVQLTGMGILVSEASYGSITPRTAIWTGSIGLVAYVVASGIRGAAWTAAVKDVLILGVAVFVGVYLPSHYYGGYGAMFAAIEVAKPGFFALPASGMSVSWFISTILLTSMGFYMWPHTFGTVYTAKNEQVFRKNAVVLPLYQLVLLFVFFAGFAAVLQVPGLTGAQADLSLLRVSRLAFSPWMVGVIGAAGILTALVPGSMLLLSASTILAQNVYRELVPTADDRRVTLVARAAVPVVAAIAVGLALRGGAAIVPLLLMGYSLVTQLFPALILSLGERPRATAAGAFAGILTGEITVAYMTISGSTLAKLLPTAPQMVKDLNVGLVAMIANVVVLASVSALSSPRRSARSH